MGTAQFDADDVKKAVSGFRQGTAPGGSRFRASYLQDALTVPTGDADRRLSGPLTDVVNLLAQGRAPVEIAPWVAGAPLYPLKKKDGGVRPVAVGEVIRRLVAKCFCAKFREVSERVFVSAGQGRCWDSRRCRGGGDFGEKGSPEEQRQSVDFESGSGERLQHD